MATKRKEHEEKISSTLVCFGESIKGSRNEFIRACQDLSRSLADAIEGIPKKKATPGSKTEGSKIWDEFVRAYDEKYGIEPAPNARVRRLAKDLVASVGSEDAFNLVGFYLKRRDQWYVSKAHPFEIMIRDAHTLRTQMKTGKVVSKKSAARQETQEGSAFAQRSFLEKKYRRSENGDRK